MATKEAAFHRLVEMGREQGFVTLDQVNATLPIDSMSQTELAQTLDRLERSGVSVEVDEELTRRPRVYDGDEETNVPDLLSPEPPDEDKVVPLRPKAKPEDGSRQGQPAAMTEVQEHGVGGHGASGSESPVRMAVVFGGLLLLLVLAFVLLR
jgi:hypothetical protein